VVDEYLEPGRTATTIEKRLEFQKMVARIKAQQDVDYVSLFLRTAHRLIRSARLALTPGALNAVPAAIPVPAPESHPLVPQFLGSPVFQPADGSLDVGPPTITLS
jgi:hypothetical protein